MADTLREVMRGGAAQTPIEGALVIGINGPDLKTGNTFVDGLSVDQRKKSLEVLAGLWQQSSRPGSINLNDLFLVASGVKIDASKPGAQFLMDNPKIAEEILAAQLAAKGDLLDNPLTALLAPELVGKIAGMQGRGPKAARDAVQRAREAAGAGDRGASVRTPIDPSTLQPPIVGEEAPELGPLPDAAPPQKGESRQGAAPAAPDTRRSAEVENTISIPARDIRGMTKAQLIAAYIQHVDGDQTLDEESLQRLIVALTEKSVTQPEIDEVRKALKEAQ